ncbi:dihydropteroate synthase [Seleniivibrio woodruffii]|uniref:dihydropteroate synthase n=1 Tax=Seleniivibrio woodruffii TaxID=1078050 RepID=UPI002409D1C9|nr:dihydropteroate synthase [Seleniivibrio woodruffii]
MSKILTSSRRDLSLEFPLLMGILNVTPDSFSDGGSFNSADGLISRVDEFLFHKVDIADIGGESTRPGSDGVSTEEELKRVVPAVMLSAANGLYVSVDTMKPQVAYESLMAGAAMINDVSGFRDPDMVAVCAEFGCSVCIMHMLGEPRSMQENPVYGDVVEDVKKYLLDAAERCIRAGIKESSICIDPGFGFGKTLEDNYKLLAGLENIRSAGFPVLAGMSRKSMIGNVVNKPPVKRLAGTLAAHTAAVLNGADIIRAHDIEETSDMLKVLRMLKTAGGKCLR